MNNLKSDGYLCYLSILLCFFAQLNLKAQAQTISPIFITEPVANDPDDPAIWINKNNPAESLIIGTDKDSDGALYVFNAQGKILDDKVVRDIAKPNNVDVAYGMLLDNKRVDIAVTTERSNSKLRVFSLPDMEAVDGGGIPVFAGNSGKFDEPMGIALYTRPSDGKIYAIVGRKDGPTDGSYLWQYLLEDDGQGNVKGTLVRKFGEFSGNKEIEAIAVDNELGYVYCSDEGVGVRKYYADPAKGNQQLALFATSGFEQDHEGIAIYKIDDGTGYILVSDQEAEQLHIFPREGTATDANAHPLLKVVRWEADDPDGIEVVNYPIPPYFMKGLVVAMSDNKTFHLYRWEDIAGNDLRIEPPGEITILLPPVLTSPVNGASGVKATPTLRWSASAGASSYQVQVSTTPAFSTTVFDKTSITSTEALVKGLSIETLYYWRVRAVKENNASDWSATWSFTTLSDITPPPAGNLVAHWKMDEGSGEQLTDATINGNNAVIQGNPDWEQGVLDLALKLDGENTHAVVSDNPSLNINKAITLSAWIKPMKKGTQYVIRKGTNRADDGYELSLSSSGKVFFRINQASSGNSYRLNSKTLYPTDGNTWMHIAATYDGMAIRIYIDGVENKYRLLSSQPSIRESNLDLSIGADSKGNGKFMGSLDELRLYNKALTASEISSLASSVSALRNLASPFSVMPNTNEIEAAGLGDMMALPNPFISELMIKFSIQEEGEYLLTLHDIKGTQLFILTQGEAEAGETFNVTFDGDELAQGLYLLRLQTPKGFSTLKLLHDD